MGALRKWLPYQFIMKKKTEEGLVSLLGGNGLNVH